MFLFCMIGRTKQFVTASIQLVLSFNLVLVNYDSVDYSILHKLSYRICIDKFSRSLTQTRLQFDFFSLIRW